MLQYIYCNEVELNEDLALSLISLADEYGLVELKDICGEFLSGDIRWDNAVELANAAEKFEVSILSNAILEYVTSNLSALPDKEDLSALPKSILAEIIVCLNQRKS